MCLSIGGGSAAFQFHKGTIRTIAPQKNVQRRLNFNSIKVRLELADRICDLIDDPFQFHKGTIRTLPSLRCISTILYFNSIKVRLEPTEDRIADRKIVFQFHKGTIRTKQVSGGT